MSYEYRVTWRREHDKRKRYRLYQTKAAAFRFTGFLKDNPDPKWGLEESWAGEHLKKLGDPVEVLVERRSVTDWSAA